MASPSVQAAVDNLIATIRSEVREEFLSLIGGSEATTKRRRPVRRQAAARKPATTKRATGAKRNPEEIEQLTATVLTYIRKHPGQRAEQIATGIGTTTRELVLPISKLLADKGLKTQGVRRGTTYTAR